MCSERGAPPTPAPPAARRPPRPRQVITVFIGSFIAGTFANQLDQFINDPSELSSFFLILVCLTVACTACLLPPHQSAPSLRACPAHLISKR